MAPHYVIFTTKPNGPGNQPHKVIAGEVEKDFVAGEGQEVIEAKDLAEAQQKMGPCPACAEGQKQIAESGYYKERK